LWHFICLAALDFLTKKCYHTGMDKNILFVDTKKRTPARKVFHPVSSKIWIGMFLAGLIIAGGGVAMIVLDEATFVIGIVFAAVGSLFFIPIPLMIIRKMQAKKMLKSVLTGGQKTTVTFNKIERNLRRSSSGGLIGSTSIDGFDIDGQKNIGKGIAFDELGLLFRVLYRRNGGGCWQFSYTVGKDLDEFVPAEHDARPNSKLKPKIELILSKKTFDCIFDAEKGLYIIFE